MFDELYIFRDGGLKQTAAQRIKNYPFNDSEELRANAELKISRFYQEPEDYFDYFDSILTEDSSFSVDITPMYCGLPVEAFTRIRSAFSKRNIEVRVMYILREPVTRLESALKMSLKLSGRLPETNSVQILKMMNSALHSREVCPRDDYQLTWSRLHQSFAPDEVYTGFYETLFTNDEIGKLAAFLELDSNLFDVSAKYNTSKFHFLHNKNDILRFQSHKRDRYNFVEKQFGFDLTHWEEALESITADSC